MGSYKEKLTDPRWQKKRLLILQRDNWECQLCGDTSTSFEIHHLLYVSHNPWESPDDHLITYCKHCHSLVSWHGRAFDMIARVVKIKKEDGKLLLYALEYTDNKYNRAITLYELSDRSISLLTTLKSKEIDKLNTLLKYSPD